MAGVADYPITFPYGATSKPYGTPQLPYHRGDDRAAPSGTPIIISGVQIGLVGSTGLSSGPHLHLQEWIGGYTGDRKPRNSFKEGTVIDIGVHPQFGNYVTIRTTDGWNDTYAHLSRIDVKEGQVIGNMYEGKTAEQWYQEANYWHQVAVDRQKLINPSESEVKEMTKKWLGRDATNAEVNQFTSQKWLSFTNWLLENHKPQGYEPVTEQLYKKG